MIDSKDTLIYELSSLIEICDADDLYNLVQ